MLCNFARNNFRNCLGLITALCVLSVGHSAMAQDAAAPNGPEMSAYIGTLLPNQIKGVTEILPTWGARYSQPLSVGYVEGGFRDSHAKGVDFDVLSVAYRYDMNTIEGFTNILYLGYQMSAYRPINMQDRIWTGGGFVGSGLMIKVASSFWLRTDLGLTVSPGTSLFLNIGFAIRAPGGN